jgi:hypothetical protein
MTLVLDGMTFADPEDDSESSADDSVISSDDGLISKDEIFISRDFRVPSTPDFLSYEDDPKSSSYDSTVIRR